MLLVVFSPYFMVLCRQRIFLPVPIPTTVAAQGPETPWYSDRQDRLETIVAQNGALASVPFQPRESLSPGFNIPAKISKHLAEHLLLLPKKAQASPLTSPSSSPSALTTNSVGKTEQCQTNTHAQLQRRPPIFLLLQLLPPSPE